MGATDAELNGEQPEKLSADDAMRLLIDHVAWKSDADRAAVLRGLDLHEDDESERGERDPATRPVDDELEARVQALDKAGLVPPTTWTERPATDSWGLDGDEVQRELDKLRAENAELRTAQRGRKS